MMKSNPAAHSGEREAKPSEVRNWGDK